MKKSNQKKVILVLAGSLVAGISTSCGRKPKEEQVNNTYATDLGYFHSQTGGYYPYPWNYYSPTMGYYGGSYGWSQTPHRLTRITNTPIVTYRNNSFRAPTPGVTPPVPKPSQIQPHTIPRGSPISKPTYTTPSSKPTSAPGVKSGGFGSKGGGAIS